MPDTPTPAGQWAWELLAVCEAILADLYVWQEDGGTITGWGTAIVARMEAAVAAARREVPRPPRPAAARARRPPAARPPPAAPPPSPGAAAPAAPPG